MNRLTHLAALDPELDAVPGTVSVWCASLADTRPRYARHEHALHYAASTMKVAVLAALYRAHEAGRLPLDEPVPVHADFASALPGAPRFRMRPEYDNDDAVWERLGGTATLGWLAERMIVRSSNLATNLVLEHVGVQALEPVWRIAGARHSVTARGIEDAAARDAGLDNMITAADLAGLFGAIARGARTPAGDGGRQPLAGRPSCVRMRDVLLAQEHRDDLAAGLPAGTRVALKNGWVTGVRHGAGVVYPDDAAPYILVVATTTPLADNVDTTTPLADNAATTTPADGITTPGDRACRLVARVAAASWADRHALGAA